MTLYAETINTFGRGCHTDIPVNKMFCEQLKKREIRLFKPINVRVNAANDSINESLYSYGYEPNRIRISGEFKRSRIGPRAKFKIGENFICTIGLFYYR